MMFTPKAPIVFVLIITMFGGCAIKDETQLNPPTVAKAEQASVEEAKEGLFDRFFAPKEVTPQTLSKITHDVRSEQWSEKDVEKSLKEVVSYMETIEEAEHSQRKMLDLYWHGEVLKMYGGNNDAANLHEIGNWQNTYLKGVLLDKERLSLDELLIHRDSLIEKALEKWSKIQK